MSDQQQHQQQLHHHHHHHQNQQEQTNPSNNNINTDLSIDIPNVLNSENDNHNHNHNQNHNVISDEDDIQHQLDTDQEEMSPNQVGQNSMNLTGTCDNFNLLSWHAVLTREDGTEYADIRTKRFHTTGVLTLDGGNNRHVLLRQSSSTKTPSHDDTNHHRHHQQHRRRSLTSSSSSNSLPEDTPRRRRHFHHNHHHNNNNSNSNYNSRASVPSSPRKKHHQSSESSSSPNKWAVYSWPSTSSSSAVANLRISQSHCTVTIYDFKYTISQTARRSFSIVRVNMRHGTSPQLVGQIKLSGSTLFKTTFSMQLAKNIPHLLPPLLLFIVTVAMDTRAAERVAVATAPQIAITAAVGASVC